MATTERTVEVALSTIGPGRARDARRARRSTVTTSGSGDRSSRRPRVEPELEGEHMLINIGPQHPATHGVLRLVLELDGETVVRCVPHIGYLHCGFEKIGEYRQYNQIIPWTDREDYLNSIGNNVRLRARRRAAVRHRDHAALHGAARDRDGAVAHHVAPGVARHHVHRHRRLHALPLVVPGTREHLQPARGMDRCAAHDVGDARGRHGGRHPGGLDSTASTTSSATFPKTIDEVDRMLTTQRHLGRPHRRPRRDVGGGGGELRPLGPAWCEPPAWPTTCAGTSRTSTTRRTTSTCRSAHSGDVYDRYLVRMEELRQSRAHPRAGRRSGCPTAR